MRPTPQVQWLRAAIVGPSISVTVLVPLFVLLGGAPSGLRTFFLNWLYGMVDGAIVAALCAGSLLAVDVSFERSNLRRLPVGRSAWAQSLAMPVLTFAILQSLQAQEPWSLAYVASTVIPVVLLALIMRFAFGRPFSAEP